MPDTHSEFKTRYEKERFCEPSGRSDVGEAVAAECALYNRPMARGWESKSVEAQQAEATEAAKTPRPKLNAEEATRLREKENLRLARQRVLQRIEQNSNPRLRKLLDDALADLEGKLRALE